MEDQHFMADRETIRSIVSAAGVKKTETVLEIGAGTGELTAFLAKKARVIAIEKDKKLCDFLFKKYAKNKNIHIICGNALKEMEKVKFDKIVSNLPYSILEPLFKKLMTKDFEIAIVTVSLPFYNKIKNNVLINSFFDMKLLFPVPRGAFSPPPRTESVVVRVVLRKDKERTAFLMREIFLRDRALVKNALREALIAYGKWLGRETTKKEAKAAFKELQGQAFLEKKGSLLTKKDYDLLHSCLKQLI